MSDVSDVMPDAPWSPLDVTCPRCGAGPGRVCKTEIGTVRDEPHKTRLLLHPDYDPERKRWRKRRAASDITAHPTVSNQATRQSLEHGER